MKEPKYWIGTPPKKCDLCGSPIKKVFIDGAVRHTGIWGFMCNSCFCLDGYGLGLGRGQKYTKQPDGKWLKTGG